MTITAKFASICPCCNVRITPGTKVEWTKGSPARHVTCTSSSTTQAAPAYMTRVMVADMPRRQSSGGSRRTGCPCGSRELSGTTVPGRSGRMCASCEYDA